MIAILYISASVITACGGFLMGKYLGYSLGFDDGWTMGERHAGDPTTDDISWQLAASDPSDPSIPGITGL